MVASVRSRAAVCSGDNVSVKHTPLRRGGTRALFSASHAQRR